jgi:hypothetical protein
LHVGGRGRRAAAAGGGAGGRARERAIDPIEDQAGASIGFLEVKSFKSKNFFLCAT